MRDHNIDSINELTSYINTQQKEIKEIHTQIRTLEHDIKPYSEYLKYAENYKELKPVYQDYIKSGKSEDFYRKHAREIILFEQTDALLRSSPLAEVGKPKLSEIRSTEAKMRKQINSLYQQYEQKKSEQKSLSTIQKNVKYIINHAKNQANSKVRNID